MRPAQMDVTVGNQRRKKAAAAMMAQMQSARAGGQMSGVAAGGSGGIRQAGGLARAGARAGMIGGQGRGIPAGLEGLYARASDFARSNLLGDQSLVAEQQSGADDQAVFGGSYAAANSSNSAPTSVVGDPGSMPAAAASSPSAPYMQGQTYQTEDPAQDYVASGGTSTGPAVANAYNWGVNYGNAQPGQAQAESMGGGGSTLLAPTGDVGLAAAPGGGGAAPAAGQYQDGQPVNGGIYYQGTIIPMGVWRAMQHQGGF